MVEQSPRKGQVAGSSPVSSTIVKNICINCGCECKNKYCSPACRKAKELKENIEDFLAGKDKTKDPRSIRRYLLETREYKCEECGNKKWQGEPIPLQVEHVDGNWENNVPGNLKLLCPNCHALTPTWGYRNRGNGRHYRRMRYAQGKSS